MKKFYMAERVGFVYMVCKWSYDINDENWLNGYDTSRDTGCSVQNIDLPKFLQISEDRFFSVE